MNVPHGTSLNPHLSTKKISKRTKTIIEISKPLDQYTIEAIFWRLK